MVIMVYDNDGYVTGLNTRCTFGERVFVEMTRYIMALLVFGE